MLDARKIIVLADDLSGAAELAGLAFAHGLTADVQRQFDPATNSQLIALDTDSRHLPPAAASDRVRQIAAEVIAIQPAWIFKKVDSVLRGNVRAEIEALLAATSQLSALLIPANPSRGRVIRGGRYFIDGVPLDQTPLADDPNDPRRSADVGALLGDDGRELVHILPIAAPFPATGIFLPEASSWSDLYRLARDASPETLLAGAADFFAALLDVRCQQRSVAASPIPIVPPALLVCGSRASWPARRTDCVAARIPLIALEDGFGTGSRTFGALAVGIGERKLAGAGTLLSFLSQLVAFVVNNSAVQTLLIEGGATAAAIAEEFNWTRFAVESSAPAGVGVLRPLAPLAPLVLIKPGSYPWPSEIWQAFVACRDG
jgi:D-threonate/D-erythronate kinase